MATRSTQSRVDLKPSSSGTFSLLDFPCCRRGFNLLYFTLLSNRVAGRPLLIAGLEGVLLLDGPTGQILLGALSAVESYLATVFNGGGQSVSLPRNRRVDFTIFAEPEKVVTRSIILLIF